MSRLIVILFIIIAFAAIMVNAFFYHFLNDRQRIGITIVFMFLMASISRSRLHLFNLKKKKNEKD